MPGAIVDAKKHDLSGPSRSLLESVDLLSPGKLEPTGEPTPYALQLIKAGPLNISKWLSALVGSVGVLGSGLSIWYTDLESEVERSVALGGTALLLPVTAVVLGWVACTDVNARARIAEAKVNGRARVLHKYLNLVEDAVEPSDKSGTTP